jgi:hypothetical protein
MYLKICLKLSVVFFLCDLKNNLAVKYYNTSLFFKYSRKYIFASIHFQVEIREPIKGKSGSGFKEMTETLRTFEKSISSFVQVHILKVLHFQCVVDL